MMKKLFVLFALFGASGAATAENEKSLHDFTVQSIDYSDMALDQYAGKVVLLVNTASYCGYTPQYEGLQALWSKYREKGLVVLGVPANDFGEQEPGNERNIKNFCKVNFQVDFPMTKKMVVDGGEGNAPLYDWLAVELGDDSRPKWNFHKYLVSKDGKPLAFFPSKVKPNSDKIIEAIEKALAG